MYVPDLAREAEGVDGSVPLAVTHNIGSLSGADDPRKRPKSIARSPFLLENVDTDITAWNVDHMFFRFSNGCRAE